MDLFEMQKNPLVPKWYSTGANSELVPCVDAPVIVGIDPGKSTGFAAYSGNELALVTSSFWPVYRWIELRMEQVKAVYIEVNTSTAVYREQKGKARNVAMATRIGRNVGHVDKESQLMAEGIARMGIPVYELKPAGKVTAKHFERLTGYTARCSQHSRDAGMMIYGRSIRG